MTNDQLVVVLLLLCAAATFVVWQWYSWAVDNDPYWKDDWD